MRTRVFPLVQVSPITQSRIHTFHLLCDKHKAVFSFPRYELDSNRSAFRADWQLTRSTSSLEVTALSGLQALAQWSGFSRAEEREREEEVRRGRSKDKELSRAVNVKITLSENFYKLLKQP